MNIIKLPPVLPGNLNLAAINQQLRTRTAQLDWSAVVSASESQLAILLEEVDSNDELLGIDGAIADNIAADIARYFEKQKTTKKKADTETSKNQQLQPPTNYEIRAELEKAVLNDLLGPAGGEEEELDEDSVSDRYLVGLLAPQQRRINLEQQDELAVAGIGSAEEGSTETSVPPTETMFPSSFGMTFYTIGLRRLQGVVAGRSGEYGLAVLMRYTLRLLTLQQFQRATALICACEFIRRDNEAKWGKEPFRIGLWVGQRTTPNHTDQSEEFCKQARGQYQQSTSGSPHQLTNCPWCGTKIDPGKHITVESVKNGRGRTLIYCGDSLGRCLFTEKQSKGEGLPILVVDEEIYRRLPTLLIATVDKFAQMPWKGEVQMLFGQVDGYCDRHGFRSSDIEDSNSHPKKAQLPAAKTSPCNLLRPPDLIIQDELHLISGPLGTLVGLYETAVDELSNWFVDGKKVRPKVVASTATIRQAQGQIHNLFLRKVQVFPPQGLDVQDNFFSRQREPGPDNPGRCYLGICATGRRLKVALIRVYIAILSASQSLYEKYGSHADPWMTLVGYFNSMRELGGMRRLVDDDIRTRLVKMDTRGLAKRLRVNLEELTSRKDSTDIPVVLDRLETPFDPAREAKIKASRQAGKTIDQLEPLDVLLATNMISVGVDVKRLGVMAVAGQPKNTAEYIQATSRVGRTYPGLVITVYNWSRPRDLSHYERFEHYHATFYQHVEALSLTPFAPRAIDRGLAALFVSLVRLAGREFNGNDQAGRIERNHPFVQAAIDAIAKRAGLVGDAQTQNLVRQALEAKLDSWLTQAQNMQGGGILKYDTHKRDGLTVELLQSAGRGNWQDFTCLNSLRNVEPTVGLILQEQILDERDRQPQPVKVGNGEWE